MHSYPDIYNETNMTFYRNPEYIYGMKVWHIFPKLQLSLTDPVMTWTVVRVERHRHFGIGVCSQFG